MVYTIIVHLVAKPEHVETLRLKLIEASQIYSKDKETIAWIVSQSTTNPREFSIIERYESESSQQYHLGNPYWATFDPYVKPLLSQEMDLRRVEEMDTSSVVNVPEKTWKETDYCLS